jgi:beta-lactamase superfamily II metal-dependent hydrolase
MKRKRWLRTFHANAALAAVVVLVGGVQAASTLDIYCIDVEGGQSTLVVTPAGQSLLIDTGYAGFDNRDPNRIFAAAHDAGVTRIDYLLITHFHADHAGGAAEVAKRLPVATFVDYGEPIEKSEFSRAPFAAYTAVRGRGASLHPRPGDKLALTGVDVQVLSAGGAVLPRPTQRTTGVRNPACATLEKQPELEGENPRSIGIRIAFGSFTFLDLGDLPGANLAALACPNNLLGHADVYLVPHHGNKDTAIPAVIAAVSPRVAIMNNGATKGGDPAAFRTLHEATGIEGVWQLHRSRIQGAANYPDAFIANLDEGPSDKGAWIKISAQSSGAFSVTNGRTGTTTLYK